MIFGHTRHRFGAFGKAIIGAGQLALKGGATDRTRGWMTGTFKFEASPHRIPDLRIIAGTKAMHEIYVWSLLNLEIKLCSRQGRNNSRMSEVAIGHRGETHTSPG